MKKPTKAWQLGLDFILGKNNKIYLIEINNATSALVGDKINNKMFFGEDIKGIDNYGWIMERYCKYLAKYLKSLSLNEINFKYIFGNEKKERFKKTLSSHEIKIGNNGIPIFCERDNITKEKNDWWTVDKKIIKNYSEELKKINIEIIGNMGEYDEKSIFPNFVLKPNSGSQGKNIVFYKKEEIVTKKDFITEEFIIQKPTTKSYHFINGKIELKEHSPRLCDYRARILIDDLGNVGFLGVYKRTSSLEIPTELSSGEINSSHPKYHVYLCNLSQQAKGTLVLKKEELFWEEISNKLGKTLYKLFLNK